MFHHLYTINISHREIYYKIVSKDYRRHANFVVGINEEYNSSANEAKLVLYRKVVIRGN